MKDRLSRRSFLAWASGLTGAAILAACAPTPTAEPKAEPDEPTEKVDIPEAPVAVDEGVTINYFAYAGGSSEEIETALVERFEEMHPNVTVEWSILGWPEFADKRTVMIAGRTIDDVFAFSSWAQYAKEGVIQDLTPYWERDVDEIDEDDLVPALNRAVLCNKIWGISQGGSNCVLWYNQDMFDEAGIDYPDDTWTYEGKFLDAAIALTRDADGRTPRDSGFDPNNVVQFGLQGFPWKYSHTGSWGHVFNAYGGRWLDDDEYPTRWTVLDDPDGIRGAQFFFDLIHEYQVMPTLGLVATGVQDVGFTAGGSAMNGVWSEVTVGLQRDADFRWAGAPMPIGPVKRSTWSAIKYYSMPEWSKEKDWAWEFLKFMLSNEAWEIKSKGGTGLLPPRYSGLAAPWFLDPFPHLDKEFLGSEEVMDSIDPWAGGWMQEFLLPGGTGGVIEDEFELVALGDITAEEAFNNIYPELERRLAEGMEEPVC